MGFTGLARWINAPTTGLDLIRQNILKNHNGVEVGRWQLVIRTYRSSFGTIRDYQVPDRTMCTLTMNNSVFVLIEDPGAPTRADLMQMHQQHVQTAAAAAAASSSEPTATGEPAPPPPNPPPPFMELPHYRNTFLTLSPPGALEQLLVQLKSKWSSTRQASSNAPMNQPMLSGQQLSVDGYVYSIGSDWLVRVGNVKLTGGALKGMLLEAEYIPLPSMRPASDETPELMSNLLTSILPNLPNSRFVAVTISEAQWEEVLWKRPDDDLQNGGAPDTNVVDGDDVFVYEDEEIQSDGKPKGDWTGIDRDRRSAFLIIGALKSEGIL